MNNSYNPQLIEIAAQEHWEKHKSFVAAENSNQKKFYCISMLPYPSGQIHMGHVRNYTIGDVIARYQRMCGKNVLQPFGWDAFGLPAENAALERKLAPAKWTYQNIEQMRTIIKRLGFAIDWDREVATCKPEYYRWEQWLFLRMYEKGLVYKKKAVVNWDPVDQTVLANEQVVDGRGWRSGALVERREISQWFLKITTYAEELLADLDKLKGWPEEVCVMQRNWIGRSEGIELSFALADNNHTNHNPTNNNHSDNNPPTKLTVFTTRPDTLMGVAYLAIAPQHPLALQAASYNSELDAFIKKCKNIKVAEADLATLAKEGVFTGLNVTHPISGEIIPVWTANFVVMDYGTGAVMSVPAHDQRDFEFAQQYNLPLKAVIAPLSGESWDYTKAAFTEKGKLINSSMFNGLNFTEAFNEIADYLIKNHTGERKVNYRLRDWGISRQRYWGTPIPMVNCPKCGTVPIPYSDLPVILPENIHLDSPQSPLTKLESFLHTTCPQCGATAQRETDTFDTFMESSWYFTRYCCPDQNQAMLDERVNHWMPVDQYIGGIEHAVMHLLYARFIYKVMRDEGLVKHDEPFTNLLTQGMVLKDGSKMSKSKGNTVSPEAIIEQYGADTARLFIIFASPPEQSLEWSDSGVEGAYRFLKRLWNFAYTHQATYQRLNSSLSASDRAANAAQNTANSTFASAGNCNIKCRSQIHAILKQATVDIAKNQLNTVVSAAMKLLNLLQEISGAENKNDEVVYEGLSILLRILAPITPHIAHHLWQELKFANEIINAAWPCVNESLLTQNEIEMIIQVNGKYRAKITITKNTNQEEIKKLALASENVKKFVNATTVKKIIVVPNKLVNIVT